MITIGMCKPNMLPFIVADENVTKFFLETDVQTVKTVYLCQNPFWSTRQHINMHRSEKGGIKRTYLIGFLNFLLHSPL